MSDDPISKLLGSVSGGFTGLFAKLKDGGLGDEVKSWVGKGENTPVTAQQVTQALGNEHVARIAEQAGVTPEQAAQKVAQGLPKMVDRITPDGQLPDAQTLQAHLSKMTGGSSPM